LVNYIVKNTEQLSNIKHVSLFDALWINQPQQRKKSVMFGTPTVFAMLITKSLFSLLSLVPAKILVKSTEKIVFDNKLIEASKDTLPISIVSPFRLH
jgi:hypothetical protein